MKKLFLLFFFISFSTVAQTYTFGACYTNATYIKTEGTITISEKKVSIESVENKKKTAVEYDAFKDKNGLIYLTDNTLIHTLVILDEKGKKKGFEHDTVMVITLDKSKDNIQIKYYCSLLQE